jgi:NtrC-family two-component system response regulator AlgB
MAGGLRVDGAARHGERYRMGETALSLCPREGAWFVSILSVRVLIIDDEKNIRAAFTAALESMNHQVVAAANGALALHALRIESFDVIFLDLRLDQESGLELIEDIRGLAPKAAIILVTAFATIETAVAAIKRGAFEYFPKPCTPEQIREVLQRVERSGKLERRPAETGGDPVPEALDFLLCSESPQMQRALNLAFKAAASDATLLLLGESGTGKSVLARAIHRRSPRAAEPFVTVSCPSLSRELLESDLFGHTRGAFTGAVAEKWGKVTTAEGGTLFLDEIGDLPLDIQARLLRLLQEREYERVGETTSRKSNVRLLAATNRNLSEAVAMGRFREDLYYRLNVISVTVPPLRERMSDFTQLVNNHLQYLARRSGKEPKRLSRAAWEQMQSYNWPGNLREMRNVLERAAILCGGDQIQLSDLSESICKNTEIRIGSKVTLAELEKLHIRRVIESSRTLEEAAHTLGIDPATLYRKRKKRE